MRTDTRGIKAEGGRLLNEARISDKRIKEMVNKELTRKSRRRRKLLL